MNLPWAAVRLLLSGDPGPLDGLRLGGRVAVTEAVTEVPEVPEVPEVTEVAEARAEARATALTAGLPSPSTVAPV